jgi:ribosomal protein S12 methylthiotransferase
MTVEQFDPKAAKKSSNSAESQTTTLDIPSKRIEEQHQAVVTSQSESERAAKVGFVSLGCPKNLVDSERILTELKTEGYDVVSTYKDAELVIVNTCGFIDSAVKESLDTIGEALAENGKVLVTGCLGA